jgi:ankyrin repeat protein
VFLQGIEHGNLATARFFLSSFDLFSGFSVHDRDAQGNQALHLAAFAGNTDEAQWLIDRGAEVDAPGKLGGSSLMKASAGGKIGVASILLQAGAEIDLAARLTAVGYAAFHGHVLMVRELLVWGADPNHMGSAQETARHAALRQDHGGIVKLLDDWGSIQAVWVVRSAEQVRRLSGFSALKRLPKDLSRVVGSMLM